jgi:hypothetical protein|tara:strand:- start:1457 stop:1834 length:378 start_codon:yes stop_codon:yes gene_type:complete
MYYKTTTFKAKTMFPKFALNNHTLELVATGGDITKMGYVDDDLRRPIAGYSTENETLVYELIRKFLELQTTVYVNNLSAMDYSERLRIETERYSIGNDLLDLGIFESKYDIRSVWSLVDSAAVYR